MPECVWSARSQRSHPFYNHKVTRDELDRGLLANIDALGRISQQSGARMILMYGGLIGYYWNKHMLPWDDDIDVHVLEQDMQKLLGWTRQHPKVPPLSHWIAENGRDDRNYQQHYKISDAFYMYNDSNPRHHIEMRLIHLATGVYTDITFLYLQHGTYLMKANLNHLWGGNTYPKRDIWPLQRCTFEGVKLWCPHNVERVLGPKKYPNYRRPQQHGYIFDRKHSCWRRP